MLHLQMDAVRGAADNCYAAAAAGVINAACKHTKFWLIIRCTDCRAVRLLSQQTLNDRCHIVRDLAKELQHAGDSVQLSFGRPASLQGQL